MMEIRLFGSLKHAILINVFLFGISNAMNQEELKFPEGTPWHKAGLTILRELQPSYFDVKERDQDFLDKINTHLKDQCLFHKIYLGDGKYIVLVTNNAISKAFKPTVIKSDVDKKIGYYIDCTDIHEDSNEDEIKEKNLKQKKEKNKPSSIPRKKGNALGYIFREKLAENEKIQKNRWFFERYAKTSLLCGCVASLSLGLFWPSIKAKIF